MVGRNESDWSIFLVGLPGLKITLSIVYLRILHSITAPSAGTVPQDIPGSRRLNILGILQIRLDTTPNILTPIIAVSLTKDSDSGSNLESYRSHIKVVVRASHGA